MGRLTLAFAVATGLAAGQDAQAQQVKSPAVIAAEQRPNHRTVKTNITTTAPVTTEADSAASRFVSTATTDAPKPGDGAPFWQPIEGYNEPMDYFRYWGLKGATTPAEAASPDFNNEIRQSSTDPHRPLPDQPVVFNFQQSAPIAMETKFAGCPFTNQPDQNVFWLNPYANADGSHTNLGKDPVDHPNYRYGVPGEWTISRPLNGVRGVSVTGAAEGNAPGAPDGGYAVAVTYVTDRRCSDANNEYGFWQELASPDKNATEKDQTHIFYYSSKTNCYSAYGCRASDSWDGPGQDQITSPLTTLSHIQSATISRRLPLGTESTAANVEVQFDDGNERSAGRRPLPPRPDPEKPGQQFTYSAYLIADDHPDADHNTGYKFRVQVTEPDRPSQFAKCSINGGPLQDCQTDVPVQNFFPAREMQINEVQVVTGTQTSGVNAPAPLTKDAKFTVKGLSIGK